MSQRPQRPARRPSPVARVEPMRRWRVTADTVPSRAPLSAAVSVNGRPMFYAVHPALRDALAVAIGELLDPLNGPHGRCPERARLHAAMRSFLAEQAPHPGAGGGAVNFSALASYAVD